LVRWFDFYGYVLCALHFAPVTFPQSDPTVQPLAAGFLMRPVGGWLLGRLADCEGRKTSMVISVSMMRAGSLLIACLPAEAAIGPAAPAPLLAARLLLQDLSASGEYGTTATYMSEVSMRVQHGFFSFFQCVTLIGGQRLAVLVVVVLQHALDEAGLRRWGWGWGWGWGSLLRAGCVGGNGRLGAAP
jgi:MHS family alpha-ketoglutarate permease-like MFS transporter